MDVVGIDYPVMDLLIRTPKLPSTNGSSSIRDYSWQCGGKVSSALAALGRLGAEAGIVGVVGGDPYGLFCRNDFIRQGVDTSRLLVDNQGTNCFCLCIAEQETQSRSILGYPARLKRLEASDLDKDYIRSARFLHLCSMNETALQAAAWVHAAGGQVVFDADWYQPEMALHYDVVDVFIASEDYFNAVSEGEPVEAVCRRISSKGPSIVFFTFGGQGCKGICGDNFYDIPAFSVEVVDTTGAGDVFHGGFIYGLLQGWEVERTAVFASAVSAIKCTCMGGRAGLPDLQMVERFLQDGTIDTEKLVRRSEFYRTAFFSDPSGMIV